MYAVYLGFVSPEMASPSRAADPVIVTLLGGVGTMPGPIVGALAYTGMKDVLAKMIGNWEHFNGFLLGFILRAGAESGRRRNRGDCPSHNLVGDYHCESIIRFGKAFVWSRGKGHHGKFIKGSGIAETGGHVNAGFLQNG